MYTKMFVNVFFQRVMKLNETYEFKVQILHNILNKKKRYIFTIMYMTIIIINNNHNNHK